MPYLLNILYLTALLLLSPWLAYKALTTGKYRRGLWTKLTGTVAMPFSNRPHQVAWFHGVSVGEIHLLRQVIAAYRRRHPDHGCVVSTTTDTGFDEARKTFADLPVFFWPFDFTWAVKTALRRVAPDLVVLAEGEIWPNFIHAANRCHIRLAIINGRMSPRSAGRYQKMRWLMRGFWQRLDLVAAQTEEYAVGFRHAGAGEGGANIVVTGNVKYDGAEPDRGKPATLALRKLFGIRPGELVWVAGSTQDPEETIILDIYRRALEKHPNLRLVLVPRQKERFDPVAGMLERSALPFERRSQLSGKPIKPAAVILLDTFGELGAAWGLADLAYVGGSLDGKRGGQNMIEAAAYGAAVTFGPYTWNFKNTVARLLQNNAAVQVADATDLEKITLQLLADADRRFQLGHAASQFVAGQQGATERTLDALDSLLPSPILEFPLVSR